MNNDMVESMFPTLAELLADKGFQSILTIEQKRTILESLNVSVEEIDDSHIRLGMLFVVLDLDFSDPVNPKMAVSMNLSNFDKS